MGQPEGYICRNSSTYRPGADGRTRLSSLLCLSLLLSLLFLPLSHPNCLHAPEGFYSRPVPGLDGQNDELHFTSNGPERPDHHHHDPAACPICQAAFNSHYFSVPTHFQPQLVVYPGQRLYPCPPATFFANLCFLISNPRSPPHMYLAS
jgi:hypothetical protein